LLLGFLVLSALLGFIKFVDSSISVVIFVVVRVLVLITGILDARGTLSWSISASGLVELVVVNDFVVDDDSCKLAAGSFL
jgi:hypothetical protein